MQKVIVTPDSCYRAHVRFCGGVSKVSGVKLPERLVDCALGVRESWYGQACFATLLVHQKGLDASASDLKHVPIPDGVDEATSAEQRKRAVHAYWELFGFYG